MSRRGPKDWFPRDKKDWDPGSGRHVDPDSPDWFNRFPHSYRTPEFKDLVRHLRAVVLVGGEGSIDTGSRGPVYISVVHDGSGFNPAAAVAVDQNPYHDLSNDTLEAAFEIMQDREMKDEGRVRELQEEWGDRWEEILTEAFEGKTWSFKDPVMAASALLTFPGMRKYIQIEDSSE